jgi:plastocyanin
VRTLLLTLLCVTALAAFSAGNATSATSVRVTDGAFKPGTLTVSRGTTVVWRFVGRKRHRLSVLHGPVKFKSPLMKRGKFRKKLTRPGTYHIVCTRHPNGHQMFISVR